MRTSRLDALAAVVIVVTLAAFIRDAVGTDAAFAVPTGNAGNTFSSIPDWRPPVVSRATVVKAEGGIPGYVRAGGSYSVVASVVDDPSSNPPAGIAAVQGTAATLTGSATPFAMPTNAATVGGLTYTHRAAAATVPAARAAGTYASSITASDLVTPANTSAPFSFNTVVDNTAPARTSVAIANVGVAGRMNSGDTITYLWNEIVDPASFLAGWTGAATPVTVQVDNFGGQRGDTVTVRNSANTVLLPLGSIELKVRDFVTAVTTFGGPANATRSSMSWNATTGAIMVTLGAPDTPATVNTTGSNTDNFEWFPQAVFDRAGNLSTTTTYLETGALDREF